MNCSLLDIACHAKSAFWQWWASLGFPVQALIVVGLLLVVVGVLWSVASLFKKIGGWPAVAGFFVLLGGVLAFVFNRKQSPGPDWIDGGDKPVRRKRTAKRAPFNTDSLTR